MMDLRIVVGSNLSCLLCKKGLINIAGFDCIVFVGAAAAEVKREIKSFGIAEGKTACWFSRATCLTLQMTFCPTQGLS